ncbi:MAG TPA: hypothetical protein VGL75_18870 [Acidothermaceae bacterium]|jgi:hypothetical protein
MGASWLTRFAFVVVAAGAVALPSTTALAKSDVPYTDSRSTGSIAFCNAAGQNITHGSVYDKPFAYRAVSSAPGLAQYRAAGRLATLYAYQPRKGVDPAEWNGDSLTAASSYTNPLVPMAEGSKRDIALSDYLDEYPLAWNGLVQLRLLVSAPNAGVDTTAYPSATIQVKGTSWSLLNPSTLSCTSGSATTSEDLIASTDPVGLGTPEPLYSFTPGVVAVTTPSGHPVAAATAKSSRSQAPVLGIVALAAAGGVVIAGTTWWRRRPSGSK